MDGLESDDPVDRGREQDPVAQFGGAQSPAEREMVMPVPRAEQDDLGCLGAERAGGPGPASGAGGPRAATCGERTAAR